MLGLPPFGLLEAMMLGLPPFGLLEAMMLGLPPFGLLEARLTPVIPETAQPLSGTAGSAALSVLSGPGSPPTASAELTAC
jgi:hypothetical protein